MALMTVQELSSKIKVSVNTLYIWTSQKRIPHIKVGHLLRFDDGIIDAWLKQNEVKEFVR